MPETFPDILRRSTAELVGTFIFVFFIGLSKNAAALQPLVPAFALLIMKYALGHVSLASLNPANSVGLFLRGVLRVKSLVAYIGAELLGGALGAAMASAFVTDKNQAVILSIKSSIGIGFLAEMLGTFILVFVSLNNTSQDHEGNSFYGMSAGLALGSIILVLDPISSACVNPAVAMLSIVGAPLHGVEIPSSVWVYFVAPFVGAGISALIFRLLSPDDHVPVQTLFKGPVEYHRLRDGTHSKSSSRLPDLGDELMN